MKKLRITIDGKVYDVTVESLDDPAGAPLSVPSAPRAAVTAPESSSPAPAAQPAAGPGAVTSPLAGRVVSIDCKPGQQVSAGDALVTLEAMKMNTTIAAQAAGTVGEISVGVGDAVAEGQTLLTIK
jgi:Acetyl/propionyl-CoA carboxylase, alpha subunit